MKINQLAGAGRGGRDAVRRFGADERRRLLQGADAEVRSLPFPTCQSGRTPGQGTIDGSVAIEQCKDREHRAGIPVLEEAARRRDRPAAAQLAARIDRRHHAFGRLDHLAGIEAEILAVAHGHDLNAGAQLAVAADRHGEAGQAEQRRAAGRAASTRRICFWPPTVDVGRPAWAAGRRASAGSPAAIAGRRSSSAAAGPRARSARRHRSAGRPACAARASAFIAAMPSGSPIFCICGHRPLKTSVTQIMCQSSTPRSMSGGSTSSTT